MENNKKVIAPMYIGTRYMSEDEVHFKYEKVEFEVEEALVNQHMSYNYTGMFFYIGLQMCWLVTAKYGFLNPFGLFGAVIAIIALWRLYVMLAKRYLQRKYPERPLPHYLYRDDDMLEEASEILKEQKIEEYLLEGKKVLSLKEYRKLVA